MTDELQQSSANYSSLFENVLQEELKTDHKIFQLIDLKSCGVCSSESTREKRVSPERRICMCKYIKPFPFADSVVLWRHDLSKLSTNLYYKDYRIGMHYEYIF